MMTDWSDPSSKPVNEHGSKARVGDRTKTSRSDYSDWRRTVGHGCYASDIDFVEWRARDGHIHPVAVIEVTFWNNFDDNAELSDTIPAYCHVVLKRFKRDAQYELARLVADRLGVPPYLVIARGDLQVFWVCRLTDDVWRAWDEQHYRGWLLRL